MTGLTAIVGGGAAGIAAARTLADAGADVLLLEARDRLGGRARSTRLAGPDGGAWTLDEGCGWLHSARRNPWTRIAETAGIAVDRRSPNWDAQWRDLGFPAADQEAFGSAWDRWETAARAAADGPDRPLSDFVATGDPWRPAIDAISGYANGASIDVVSLHDWLAYEDAAGPDNWALPSGYGTLVAGYGANLPHRLNTPVSVIDRRGARLRLETPAGAVDADRAIVCVPTAALANGNLRFLPDLPDKAQAAADLPLGLADKAFLHVAGSLPWNAHAHLIGDPRSACTGSYRLSPFGWPVIECFLGGPCAEALEGPGAAEAFAIDELAALLGNDWRARLTPMGATRWRQESWIGGSYSHARVGRRSARTALAQPVEGRILFAGEACHPFDFSTAHGAYETGVAAARAVLAGAGEADRGR